MKLSSAIVLNFENGFCERRGNHEAVVGVVRGPTELSRMSALVLLY